MMFLVLYFLLTYLLAAMPIGYWMGKLHGIDLTQTGSGSTGATNVMRLVGKWQALVVFSLDMLKGFLPIYYAKNYSIEFNSVSPWILLCLTLVPIIAHSKSIFIGFKGGKSSATGFGVLLALNPLVAVVTIATWSAVVFFSGFSSLGSIISVPLVPIWLYVFGESVPVVSFGVLAFIYIVLIKHYSNIIRLVKGEEYNFRSKKD